MRVEEILAKADASDGLGVQEVVMGGGADVSLHYIFRQAGEIVYLNHDKDDDHPCPAGMEIWCARNPDERKVGDKIRTKLLLEAICRFLNTGGELQSVITMARYLKAFTRQGMQLEIPGFYLLESHVNDDGEFEHLFSSEKGIDGIRWVEHRFIEPVRLVDELNEVEASGDDPDQMELFAEPDSGEAEGTADDA